MTSLSNREQAVAERYGEGHTYKEIALHFGLAPATIRNHLSAVYRKLGVRNKPELIKALRSGVDLPRPEDGALSGKLLDDLADETPKPPRLPSIAVLAFNNIGPPETEYFCHGIAADIQHYLTRCHDLLVAGRTSSLAVCERFYDAKSIAQRLGVQFLLQGSVRSQFGRVCLTAELVDGLSGSVVWSERFNRELGAIVQIEAEVASQVVTSLSLQIEALHLEQDHQLSDDQLGAYDWRLRGNRLLESGGKDNLAKAEDCFGNALKLQPMSAPAHAGLSMCHGYACDLLLTADYQNSLQQHVSYAEAAIRLDDQDSRGHYAVSCAYLLQREYERADEHAIRGLELNPSEYHNLCNRGYSLMSLGRMGDSLNLFTQSLRRNPLAPNSCLLAISLIEYLEENYGQSVLALNRMSAAYVQKSSTLAAACAQTGHEAASRAAAAEFQRISRQVPLCPSDNCNNEWRDFWRLAYPYLTGEAHNKIVQGIAKAKLPV